MLDRLDRLDRPDNILHFAPEPRVAARLKSIARNRYVGADLDSVGDVCLDITRLPLPDRSIDLIVCCHVLEHIRDDGAAIAELGRVLTPNGVAIIQFPTGKLAVTDEDFDLDADERTLRYGQADHVRQYGADVVSRLSAAFDDVTVVCGVDGPSYTVAPSCSDVAGFKSGNNGFECRSPSRRRQE
ncbi:MAG: class I SAM-dependent methyltransferase [Acidimicrobiales bacterium]|nr:class I SAM-dependent methyltransferase [Acidimicrobiales bacterium]